MQRESITHEVKIFVSGPIQLIKQACTEYCSDVGLCVTVTPTDYVYSHGEESGAIIGLINYPKFPSTPDEINKKAHELAITILNKTHHGSYTIQAPYKTIWFSRKKEDNSD